MNKLNFFSDIVIKSYQYYAFPLGILATNKKLYNNWIIGKFINIYFGMSLQYDELSYDDWEMIDQKFYKNFNKNFNLEKIIEKSIENKYAIHLWNINEKFIFNSVSYKKFDFLHDLLIIGYNDINKSVIIVNYDKNKKLSINEISINDLKDSITINSGARIFKFRDSDIKVCKPYEIYNNIKNYINPKYIDKLIYYDKILNNNSNIITGIYSIREFINFFIKNPEFKNYINSICLINEHKKIIYNNLNYLNSNNFISKVFLNEYKEIVDISNIIKYKFLKFILKPDKKLRLDIIEDLEKLIYIEYELLINFKI